MFRTTVTMAVPMDFVEHANALLAAATDDKNYGRTFGSSKWEGADASRYSVASFVTDVDWFSSLQAVCENACISLDVWDGRAACPAPKKTSISLITGLDARSAITLWGLEPI